MLVLTLALLAAAKPFDPAIPLTDAEVKKAKAWIELMTNDRLGPYEGVLWYCADGEVLAPKLNACIPHGGGKMYGVPKYYATKLGEMGLYLGTILTPLPAGSFLPDNFYRARAIIVEMYLERALAGWTLKKPENVRGFRQMEDEEKAARWLLIDLAMRKEIITNGRNLLVRSMLAVPYGKVESRAAEVRALAGLLGDADVKGFGALRFKIHSLPEPSDVDRVQAYAAAASEPELVTQAEALLIKMREYYEPVHRLDRLREVKQWIWDKRTKAAIDTFVAVDPEDPVAMVRLGTELMETAEAAVAPGSSTRQGERNLLLFHAMSIVEELWLGLTAKLAERPLGRGQLIALCDDMVRAAGALGWLSPREEESARMAVTRMRGAAPPESGGGAAAAGTASGPAESGAAVGGAISPANYAAGVRQLARVLEWARARMQADVEVALDRYAAVEPRARGVIDDQLRQSMMLPFAALLDRLTADVERLRGGGHLLLGLGSVGTGSLRGENAGLTTGPLRVVSGFGEPEGLARGDIVLLNDLPPDLPPVAGIITVGATGSLSHVALLARNLGIPHAAIGGDVAAALSGLAGQTVVLGVSGEGRVVLGAVAALPEGSGIRAGEARPTKPFLSIDAKALDLAFAQVTPLSEISEKDSGKRVGPKAGELGRLRALFSDRVSNGVVIPFGAFVRHVDRPGQGGEPSPLARLRAMWARVSTLPPDAAEVEALAELARFREAIATLPFADGFEADVDRGLALLGRPGTFGVFVRSDTNVEDLKDFTGAGLNLTVPNRVARSEILAAVREVWASPFSERSFRWRQRLLQNPEHVYPSVILHQTVASEISGVMVTVDLETGARDALTVSVGEGVAAVVDGGAPETLVLETGGGTRLLASPRSATCKLIPKPPASGIVRAQSRGLDPLLGPAELAELRRLAAEVTTRVTAKADAPWDIELGFVRGKAYLMQIRPLKTAKAAVTHPFLRRLDSGARLPSTPLSPSEIVPKVATR